MSSLQTGERSLVGVVELCWTSSGVLGWTKRSSASPESNSSDEDVRSFTSFKPLFPDSDPSDGNVLSLISVKRSFLSPDSSTWLLTVDSLLLLDSATSIIFVDLGWVWFSGSSSSLGLVKLQSISSTQDCCLERARGWLEPEH